MAKDDHWFKFYYRLMVVSTQGWKDDEFGAYVRLLIHQFDKGGLPDDPGELSKLISTFKKNWPALSKKFKRGDDGLLRNDFMKTVRDERDKKSTTASENGKTGGRGKKKLNKAEALQNESNTLSPSFSSSQSVGEEGGLGEEEEVGLEPEGFLSTDLDKAMVLTDIEIGATIEYIRLTCKKVLDNREVVDQWEAFKIRQFSVKEWYSSHEKLLNHFRDSLKIQIKNGAYQSSGGEFKPKSAGGKSAGANKLAGMLQSEIRSTGS